MDIFTKASETDEALLSLDWQTDHWLSYIYSNFNSSEKHTYDKYNMAPMVA